MTENVYELTHNYRVKSEAFKEILLRLRGGQSTPDDATIIFNQHKTIQGRNHMREVERHPKTMFLFTNDRFPSQVTQALGGLNHRIPLMLFVTNHTNKNDL